MIKKLLLLNCAPLLKCLACCAPKELTAKMQVGMCNPLPCVSFLLRGKSIGTRSDAKETSSPFPTQSSCHLLSHLRNKGCELVRNEYILT